MSRHALLFPLLFVYLVDTADYILVYILGPITMSFAPGIDFRTVLQTKNNIDESCSFCVILIV